MSKRAAIIITDAPVKDEYGNPNLYWSATDGFASPEDWIHTAFDPSERLLADLRLLAEVAQDFAVWYGHGFKDGRPMLANEVLASAARVRALLPKGEAA